VKPLIGRSRIVSRALVPPVVLAALLVAPAYARANSLTVTSSPSPAQADQLVTTTYSGQVDPPTNGGSHTTAEIYAYAELHGQTCAPTDLEEGARVNAMSLSGMFLPDTGSFSYQAQDIFDAGSYLVCAYLDDFSQGSGSSPSVTIAAERLVVVARCVVPYLVGLRVSSARAALARSHCSLGRVTKKHVRGTRRGRVTSQHPASGHAEPNGFAVSLVVAK
jgi:hypothetical protein